jgi:hypothetical protein
VLALTINKKGCRSIINYIWISALHKLDRKLLLSSLFSSVLVSEKMLEVINLLVHDYSGEEKRQAS